MVTAFDIRSCYDREASRRQPSPESSPCRDFSSIIKGWLCGAGTIAGRSGSRPIRWQCRRRKRERSGNYCRPPVSAAPGGAVRSIFPSCRALHIEISWRKLYALAVVLVGPGSSLGHGLSRPAGLPRSAA